MPKIVTLTRIIIVLSYSRNILRDKIASSARWNYILMLPQSSWTRSHYILKKCSRICQIRNGVPELSAGHNFRVILLSCNRSGDCQLILKTDTHGIAVLRTYHRDDVMWSDVNWMYEYIQTESICSQLERITSLVRVDNIRAQLARNTFLHSSKSSQ